jgi:putative endonuclease
MTVGRSTSPTHQVGQKAEEAAIDFLTTKGFQLVAQNYHSPLGELDLVVTQDRLLVFVEVRFRKAGIFGNAAASITPSKQRKIIQTSMIFLQSFPEFESFDCRYDVIAIDCYSKMSHENYKMNWIEGAFDASILVE